MPDRIDREYQSRVRRNRQKKVKPPAGVKGPVRPRPKPAPSPEDTRTPRQPRLTRQEKREIEEITGTLTGAITRGSRKVQRSGERFVGTVGALAAYEARLRAIAAFQKMGLEGSKPYNLSEILHGTRKVTDTIPAVGEALGRGAFDLGKKQVAEGGIPRALKHNLWDDQRGTLGYLSGDWFAQSKNQERVAEATMGKAAANLLYHGDRSHPIAASLEIGSMFPVFKWAKVVTDIARGGKRAKQAAEAASEAAAVVPERPLPRPSIPPTLAEIDKRLPAMDKEYERLVKKTEERFEMDPDAVRLETRYRNRGRGKRAYGKAKQPTPQKTVSQEKRAAAEAAIYKAAPKVPGLKAFLDERDALRARRNELIEGTFDKPTRVLPVSPPEREPMVTPEVMRAALAKDVGEPGLGAQYLEHSPVGREIAGKPPLEEVPLPPEKVIQESLSSWRYQANKRAREISAARKERIGKHQTQYEASGGGREGLAAAAAELAGEIPTTVRLAKLKGGTLTEEELDDMVRMVMDHPVLRPYERRKAARTLEDVFDHGRNPRKNEIELLRMVFGDDADVIIDSARLRKLGELTIDVVNIPRSIMASVDLSAPLRQGFVGLFISPEAFFKAWKPMFTTLTSEPRYQAFLDKLEEHPLFELAERMGVNFTELRGKTALNREEVFSSQIAEKITGGRYSPVRASGRAYTAFLDKLRLDLFEELIRVGKAAGHNMEDAKQLRSVATLVNAATGRGGLGSKLESSAPLLNAIFFAPRLIASRIQMFTLPFDPRQSQFVRLEAARAMTRMAGSVTMILALAKWAGADVEVDPRSSDFGKIKLGDTRIDLLGGFQQYIRFASQMATQQTKSPVTGKVKDLGAGLGQTSAKELAYRFLESKSAPPVSFLMDLAAQENFKGDPFSWESAVKERLTPLAISDALETGRETGSVSKAVGAYVGAGLGLGVQTFHDERPEERAKKLKDWQTGAEKDWDKLGIKTPLPQNIIRAARDRDAIAARKEALPHADVAEDDRTNEQYGEYQRARFQMVTEYLYQTYPQWKAAKPQLDGLYRRGNPVVLDTYLTSVERKLGEPLTQFNSMLANRKKIERAK